MKNSRTNQSVAISSLTISDASTLAALYRELIDEDCDLVRMKDVLCRIHQDEKYYLLGAKQGEELVGSLLGIVCMDPLGKCIPFMVVENVIVRGEFQGRGVGTRLLSEIEGIAQKLGCRYVTLISSTRRGVAHQFYCRLGYSFEEYRGYKKMLVVSYAPQNEANQNLRPTAQGRATQE